MSSLHEEEQQLELEALESLFPHDGEFIKLGQNKFEMNLLPYPNMDQVNHVQLQLQITYPKTYPSVGPIWSFLSSKGLDETQLNDLQDLIKMEIQNNIGCPMMYMVAEAIQSFLQAHNKPIQSSYDQMISRQATEASRKIQTSVTTTNDEHPSLVNSDSEDENDSEYLDSESSDSDSDSVGEFKGLEEKELCGEDERMTDAEFSSWSQKFKKEMTNKGIWGKKSIRSTKLSGKQMFERDHTLVKTAVDDNEELLHQNGGVNEVKCYDEMLFLEGDGEPDFSSDDDVQ